MPYLDESSLANTIDNVSEALLFGLEISDNEKQAIAVFLVKRHYAPGGYANMFAPTDSDLKRDLVLFTGEKIKTNAGRCHMMGEEASRILRKMNINNDKIEEALKEADAGIQKRIAESGSPSGRYCCKNCSGSLWLNLSAGGLNNDTEQLKAGLQFLKQHREDKGTWKGFHYYYTLYILNEIRPELVMDELRFAEKSIIRWINRKNKAEDKYQLRRNYIGERILDKINLK
jgi:hypothetical protein